MTQPTSLTHADAMPRTALALVLAVFVALSTAMNFLFPVFEGPDESSHFQYARLLAQGKGLPVETDPERSSFAEGFNPPLYYFLPALVLRWADPERGAAITVLDHLNVVQLKEVADAGTALPPMNPNFVWLQRGFERNWYEHPEGGPFARGPLLAVHQMRFTSTLCGCITIVGVWRLARSALPRQPLGQTLAVCLVAFNPQFVYLASVLNSDNLVIAFATLVLWRLAALLRTGEASVVDAAWLGLLLGLGALAKTNMLFLGLPTLVVLWLIRRDMGQFLGLAGIVGGLVAALAGWFFLRNCLLYGAWDFFGWEMRKRLHPVFVLPAEERWEFLSKKFLPVLFQSYWGLFGWITIPLQSWQYAVYGLVAPSAVLSWRRASVPASTTERRLVYLLWGSIVLNLASLIAFNFHFRSHQGRLLFPTLGALAVLFGMALEDLTAERPTCRRWLAVIVPIVLVALVVYAQVSVIAPVYFAANAHVMGLAHG